MRSNIATLLKSKSTTYMSAGKTGVETFRLHNIVHAAQNDNNVVHKTCCTNGQCMLFKGREHTVRPNMPHACGNISGGKARLQ
jgi:hypothetical protein